MRATIKSTLAAILDKLILNSRIGRWLHSARARIVAILASLLTLMQPPTVLTAGTGGGSTDGSTTLPVGARADVSPRTQSEMASVDQRAARISDGAIGMLRGDRNHHVLAGVWTPSLSSIAEQPQMVIPVVGRVSERAVALSLSLPDDCGLCDDGATVDCSKTAMGRIPGTFTENESELSIGESSATLVSRGMWYHAFTRIGADGT